MASTESPSPRATLLITGASGFLGSHLTARLIRAGYRVVITKRCTSDLRRLRGLESEIEAIDIDATPVESLFDRWSIDAVIHCATNYGRNGATAANVVETNLILPLRLLQAAMDRGVRAFINSDTILDPRISHYSLSKKQLVEWLEHLATKVTTANVALEHFYGPGDDPSKFVASVVRDLVRGVDSIALTPGHQKRDFIFIDDVVEAFRRVIEFALEAPAGFYRFEVGTNELRTIREFVEAAHRLSGARSTSLEFGALDYRDNEVMESHADTTALRTLGWTPQVSLHDGLMKTIEAERKNLA
jgi:CDP-paratose synthetase